MSANDLFSSWYTIGLLVLAILLSALSLFIRFGMSSCSFFFIVTVPHIAQAGVATILQELMSPIQDITIIATEKMQTSFISSDSLPLYAKQLLTLPG